MAYRYHFQPSEMWAMEIDELLYWYDRIKWITEQESSPRGR